MGTNYYWKEDKPPCKTCGHDESAELHIGKSSGGWAFLLHVIPELKLINLARWQRKISDSGKVFDEYGREISIEELEAVITERDYSIRHEIDGRHCVGHGTGSWDYMAGEFS